MNCLVINNPRSGKCKSLSEIDKIKNKLSEKYEVDVIHTERRAHATDIANENCEKYDVFVVVGGDGTFNEVLKGVAGKDKRPIIGYIPVGTVNDLARSSNLPANNVDKAVKVILEGRPVARSCMYANGEASSYFVGTGMITSVSWATSQKWKRRIGKLAYYLKVAFGDKCRFGENLKVIKTDDEETAHYQILVMMSGMHIGGLKLIDKCEHNASTFALAFVRRRKGPVEFIRSCYYIVKAIFFKANRVKQNRFFDIERLQSCRVVSLSGKAPWNVDGEYGAEGDIEVTIKQNQYELIVPKIDEEEKNGKNGKHEKNGGKNGSSETRNKDKTISKKGR
jgi:diacylglycerol kinase (ATP)